MLACSSVQQYPVLDCVTDGFTRAVRKRAWSNVLVMQTLAVTWGNGTWELFWSHSMKRAAGKRSRMMTEASEGADCSSWAKDTYSGCRW